MSPPAVVAQSTSVSCVVPSTRGVDEVCEIAEKIELAMVRHLDAKSPVRGQGFRGLSVDNDVGRNTAAE